MRTQKSLFIVLNICSIYSASNKILCPFDVVGYVMVMSTLNSEFYDLAFRTLFAACPAYCDMSAVGPRKFSIMCSKCVSKFILTRQYRIWRAESLEC